MIFSSAGELYERVDNVFEEEEEVQNVCISTAAAFHCIGGAILQIPICTGFSISNLTRPEP